MSVGLHNKLTGVVCVCVRCPPFSVAGVKSTFRVFNKKRLMTLGRNNFNAAEGEHWLFWNYQGIPYLGKLKATVNDKTYVFSPEVIR
eukprot:88493-Prorocentrum_minimum.AAC.1